MAQQRRELGRRIAEARKAKRWKQRELAAAVHVEPTTVSRWENGRHAPDLDVLEEIARATDRPLSFFVDSPSRNGHSPLGSDDEAALRHREIRDLLVARLPPVIEFRTALRAAQLLAGYDDERLAQRLERAAGELGVDRADADWRGVIHAFRSGDLTPSPESRLVVDRALPRLRDLEANPTLLLRELVDALAAASDAGTSNGS